MAIPLEPGPLELIPDDRFPIRLYRPVFESLAAAHVGELAGEGGRVADAHARMADDRDGGNVDSLSRALEAAEREHAGQAAQSPPDLTGETAAGEDLDGDVRRLAGELPPAQDDDPGDLYPPPDDLDRGLPDWGYEDAGGGGGGGDGGKKPPPPDGDGGGGGDDGGGEPPPPPPPGGGGGDGGDGGEAPPPPPAGDDGGGPPQV